MNVAAIVPAAGAGRRLHLKTSKAFVSVFGKPLIIHTLLALSRSFSFKQILVAVAPEHFKKLKKILHRYKLEKIQIVLGGPTRAESVRNAVWAVSGDCDWVLVHDAARPLVSKNLVSRLLKSVKIDTGVLAAVPLNATVKKVYTHSTRVQSTENREVLFLAQTPQVFSKKRLEERYRALGAKALRATDEAALFDGSRVALKIVLGEERNIKITTKADLDLMRTYLKKK